VLDVEKQELSIREYKAVDIRRAERDYLEAETRIIAGEESHAQAVLVSATDVRALKRAYPNYWLDTVLYIQHLERVMA
jgi:hypothetical protein